MRMVFLGTGQFGVPALHDLCRAGHEVVAAVSQPDRPAGRGRRVRPSFIHAAADQLGIPHVQTDDVNALDPTECFRDADIAVVAAFGQKIGRPLLAALPQGMINAHASLLPKYRGAAPFQWAILNGEQTTGVTVFQLDADWDAGPILGTRETPIGGTETAVELHARLSRLGAELLVEIVAQIEAGTASPRPQGAACASRAPKLTRADSLIDFAANVFHVKRRILGLWSWPAATCTLHVPEREPLRLQLARADVAHESTEPTDAHPPGTLLDDLTVQTGCGRLQLLELKPAGGRLMSFESFANGRRLKPPARLATPPKS